MKKVIIKVAIVCAIILCSFTITYAIEGQFEINATVTPGGDTTAPSIPAGLTATAVSTSQINLSWTASTDNVAVTSYNIFRDNAFLTSTALTTHSDTGLTSATTYAYTVSALDAATNESARSATSSATTFTEASSGGPSGSYPKPIIYDVVVMPSQTGAVISWKTVLPSLGNLSWGLTSSNELGVSGGVVFGTNHSVVITGLLSGTQYHYSIEAISGYGVTTTLSNQTFRTLPLPEGNLNPTNFVATARQADILLTWKNPTAVTFDEVRLVRSKSFFPTDPDDGEVVYEGRGERMVDSDVVPGVMYYYALFAKDTSGTFSSGSLARARIKLPGEPDIPPPPIFDGLPKAPSVHPLIGALTFLDFDLIQDGKKIATFANSQTVTIDGEKNLTVSLDYRKVPEVLKSIVVTLSHPTDKEKTFSFLLRVNDEKTIYSATIAPLGESGKYGVNIAIVDFKNQGLKEVIGNLVATVIVGFGDGKGSLHLLIKYIVENSARILFLVIVAIILIWSFKEALGKKKKKKDLSAMPAHAGQVGKDESDVPHTNV